MQLKLTVLVGCFIAMNQAATSTNPWHQCKEKSCATRFSDGKCDLDCSEPECLRDGFDCVRNKGICRHEHVVYCRDYFDNSHCDQGCHSPHCGWDGSDCHHSPIWAKGTLILQTKIPFLLGEFPKKAMLWAVSTLLMTTVKLRGWAPFQHDLDLYSLQPQQLADLLKTTGSYAMNGSVLFLQVDNRPCSQLPDPCCFPFATGAADYLQAKMSSDPLPSFLPPEIQAILTIRGVKEEIGDREVEKSDKKPTTDSPPWLWPVVGVGIGLGLAVVSAVLLVVWVKRRRQPRDEGERVRHRSTATDSDSRTKVWTQRSDTRKERGQGRKDKEKNGGRRKNKGKESGKRRREPLGQDSIRLRPLRKDLDIASDTDMTQSSMEDVSMRGSQRQDTSICDHRPQEQKHFRLSGGHHQSQVHASPRGWDRNASASPQRSQNPSSPVQWCGPDGSVVLIRAVRSGLDRVVLELLRAGVPVNNTDHTGRSALHWACSVNHLSMARTLIRYGAAVNLQDHKGETPLFLSAIHGCYDTARFLLISGANQDLTDRRGRRPHDMAREGMHHQVLELLLAHRMQRGPLPVEPASEVLWDDRGYLYSPWAGTPCLPGRSASFSGVIGHRQLPSPQPSEWSVSPQQCDSPQNWHPASSQSTTALVTPRIFGRPPRPISTLQEVTSEAEEEDREAIKEAPRAVTPHCLSPQPAPRQRSFSCTQNALQHRSSGNQSQLLNAVSIEKPPTEHTEKLMSPLSKFPPSQSENKAAISIPLKAQTDSEKEMAKNSSQKSDKVKSDINSAQCAQ
ncbi:neurogenic locus notch homolog protein 1 isoform X2 [Denticeps clupeoides]|uniref:neurogenic locus notch homolog protein 1 isoform X2 n=1 Tax=Denticeps clupeoides TaxID=299321 RepID=UPI0010A33BDD|nr:neurogenic locus notch homolog protein 1-like isoform X2 [Denticeps clupeoides]